MRFRTMYFEARAGRMMAVMVVDETHHAIAEDHRTSRR